MKIVKSTKDVLNKITFDEIYYNEEDNSIYSPYNNYKDIVYTFAKTELESFNIDNEKIAPSISDRFFLSSRTATILDIGKRFFIHKKESFFDFLNHESDYNLCKMVEAYEKNKLNLYTYSQKELIRLNTRYIVRKYKDMYIIFMSKININLKLSSKVYEEKAMSLFYYNDNSFIRTSATMLFNEDVFKYLVDENSDEYKDFNMEITEDNIKNRKLLLTENIYELLDKFLKFKITYKDFTIKTDFNGTVVIIDGLHKDSDSDSETTSNIKKWKKCEDELRFYLAAKQNILLNDIYDLDTGEIIDKNLKMIYSENDINNGFIVRHKDFNNGNITCIDKRTGEFLPVYDLETSEMYKRYELSERFLKK